MNDAQFAIPGLMPPKAPNWMSELKAPEDGSLCLLIHAGNVSDEVNYTVHVFGNKPGVIKDPSYEFAGERDNTVVQLPRQAIDKNMNTESWPSFVTMDTKLPEDALIPRRTYCGCPIPINELPWLKDLETVWYWILRLPIRSLPVGDSKVEVCINGHVKAYVVHRPPFDIHRKDNLTPEYSLYKAQYEITDGNALPEGVQIDVHKSRAGAIIVPTRIMQEKFPQFAPDEFVSYLATISMENSTRIFVGHVENNNIEFSVDPTGKTGTMQILVEASLTGRNDTWLPIIESHGVLL